MSGLYEYYILLIEAKKESKLSKLLIPKNDS